MCWQLAQEESIISEHLVNIGRRDAYTRVGHLYAELYWRLDTVGLVQDFTYTLPLSQTMLADALGLSFVHISRTIRRLRQDGLVQVNGSRVVIDDLPALERAVDFEHSLPTRHGRTRMAETLPSTREVGACCQSHGIAHCRVTACLEACCSGETLVDCAQQASIQMGNGVRSMDKGAWHDHSRKLY